MSDFTLPLTPQRTAAETLASLLRHPKFVMGSIFRVGLDGSIRPGGDGGLNNPNSEVVVALNRQKNSTIFIVDLYYSSQGALRVGTASNGKTSSPLLVISTHTGGHRVALRGEVCHLQKMPKVFNKAQVRAAAASDKRSTTTETARPRRVPKEAVVVPNKVPEVAVTALDTLMQYKAKNYCLLGYIYRVDCDGSVTMGKYEDLDLAKEHAVFTLRTSLKTPMVSHLDVYLRCNKYGSYVAPQEWVGAESRDGRAITTGSGHAVPFGGARVTNVMTAEELLAI